MLMTNAEPTLDPVVTPDVAAEHGLIPEEFERIKKILGREPNFTELGIFSVMWSEHCSYKNSRKELKKLPTIGPNILVRAGEENAGVVDIGDGWAIAFKMESHNHPSAIEPFQGAATGVGGIIRDIFTMGARPEFCKCQSGSDQANEIIQDRDKPAFVCRSRKRDRPLRQLRRNPNDRRRDLF